MIITAFRWLSFGPSGRELLTVWDPVSIKDESIYSGAVMQVGGGTPLPVPGVLLTWSHR